MQQDHPQTYIELRQGSEPVFGIARQSLAAPAKLQGGDLCFLSNPRALAAIGEFDAGVPKRTEDTCGMNGLDFRVERWNAGGTEFEALLAAASGCGTAFAAYSAAVSEFPAKCIILVKAGHLLAHSERELGAAAQQCAEAKPRHGCTLSQRQYQVLSLLLRGMSMKAVARILGISARTVAFHKYRVMAANRLRNNVDLMEFGHQQGLLAAQNAQNLAAKPNVPSAIQGR